MLRVVLAWLLCCSSTFAAVATNQESRFLTNTRQLTFDGKRSGEGYFSTDGQALIFQSERDPDNPFYQIYILDLASGDSHRVSPGVGKTTCAFFRPHSAEVLFASTHLDPNARAKEKAELEFRASGKQRRYSWDYDEHFDIFASGRDGSQLLRLTKASGYDAEAAYSPDGSKIVFCSTRHAYPTNKLAAGERKRLQTDVAWFGEVYIMNADGSDQRRLTSTPGYDGGPFFSPDGQRIIWRRFDENGVVADVYTMRLDGSDVRRLTDFGCMSWAPFYHPSGQYVIFTANKLGFENFELFLVDAAGLREPARVSHTIGFDGLPVFSPDGKKLCWTSGRTASGQSQLFLAEWNHAAALATLANSSPRSSRREEAHFSPSISTNDLLVQVELLASDELEGRMTGSAGARQAAEFIASYFRSAGLSPVGTNQSFFQEFSFTAGVQVISNRNHLAVGDLDFALESDFRPLSFTANAQAEGEVVFAGYGLVVPGKPGEGYDSYAGLDVSNKIVLALRYVPEEVDSKRRAELNRYAGLRYKAMSARERGAKAILFVTGPNSPKPGELAALSFDTSIAGSSIVAASVSTNVASVILRGSGKDLKTLQTALDKEDPHAQATFAVKGTRVKVASAVEHIKKTDRNVLATLHSRDPKPTEYILVGAHYDHLGRGEAGAMLRAGEENQIHNGADDNGSGVAAVLELAAAFASEYDTNSAGFQRGIIFALWSGEEIGLVGSSHFAEHPPLALSNIVAYVNFDMVGRLHENKLTLQGVGSSQLWRRLIEKRNVAAGFNLVLQDDPYLPTDVTALYPKGIPVLAFFTGSHEDYHRPTDDAKHINYLGLQRITQFARAILSDLAKGGERPDYVKVEPTSRGGSRENLRAYLGTIPDYTSEVAGVKLSGVRGGSPAEKAGLKNGDIIVEFAGQKIANIYDYTYALDAVKIGQPVQITIERDGKRETITATPEARK